MKKFDAINECLPGKGPYQKVDGLVVLDYDISKVSWSYRSKVKKIIELLPEGIAIVGGFARGIFQQDFRTVGDMDLAVPSISEDRSMWGYGLTVREKDIIHFYLRIESFLEGLDYKKDGLSPLSMGAYRRGFLRREPDGRRWNRRPVRKRWNRWPAVDVVVGRNSSLEDLLGEFDISVTQFAFLDSRLYATSIAVQDCSEGRFRLVCDTTPGRILQYEKKGFKHVKNSYQEVKGRKWK